MMDEGVRKKLKELEELDLHSSWCNDDLWSDIELQLDESKKGKRRYLNVLINTIPWAAILIMAAGVYFWSGHRTSEIEIEEVMVENQIDTDFYGDELLAEGKDFINEACSKQLEICQSDQFKVLYEELIFIEEEKKSIQILVDQYGSDETSTMALIELENAESSVTSELISLIVS